MGERKVERRLAAIMAADVVGYSRLVGEDEEGTLERAEGAAPHEAAAKLLLSIQENPGYPYSYRVLAACYAQMGRLDAARAIIARLRSITPRLVPSAAQLRSTADRELFGRSSRGGGGSGMTSTSRLGRITMDLATNS
jgi:hypothetical protein